MNVLKKLDYLASQTAIKDFEKDSTCPFRWRSQWINKEFSTDVTVPMLYGQYFESMVIGGTAKDGEVTSKDLPKNKNGSKKADEIRIEEQAEYCKKVLFDKSFEDYIGNHVGYEIEWTDSQVVIVNEGNRIVLDLEGMSPYGPVIADLKLTADAYNTYGGYAWGEVSNLDLFQQGFYELNYEAYKGVDVHGNLLIVFDYSPRKGKKIIEVELTEEGANTIINRRNAFEETIEYYEEKGWPYVPSMDECKACPLMCKFRAKEYPVVKESVYI